MSVLDGSLPDTSEGREFMTEVETELTKEVITEDGKAEPVEGGMSKPTEEAVLNQQCEETNSICPNCSEVPCPNKSYIERHSGFDRLVGDTVKLTLHIIKHNNEEYQFQQEDHFVTDTQSPDDYCQACDTKAVSMTKHKAPMYIAIERRDKTVPFVRSIRKSDGLCEMFFTVHIAGNCLVHIKLNGLHLQNSPMIITFFPGPISFQRSGFIAKSIIVSGNGMSAKLPLAFFDDHGNRCSHEAIEKCLQETKLVIYGCKKTRCNFKARLSLGDLVFGDMPHYECVVFTSSPGYFVFELIHSIKSSGSSLEEKSLGSCGVIFLSPKDSNRMKILGKKTTFGRECVVGTLMKTFPESYTPQQQKAVLPTDELGNVIDAPIEVATQADHFETEVVTSNFQVEDLSSKFQSIESHIPVPITVTIERRFHSRTWKKRSLEEEINPQKGETFLLAELDDKHEGITVHCYTTPDYIFIIKYRHRIFKEILFKINIDAHLLVTLDETGPEHVPTVTLETESRILHIATPERDIFAASILNHMKAGLIGNSATFFAKQNKLMVDLDAMYALKYRDARNSMFLRVSRDNILNSSFESLRHHSNEDWAFPFSIEFPGDRGNDLGGPRREWMELLMKELFNPHKSDLFITFSDNGPIFPNHNLKNRPQLLKRLEFAGKIVAKCLIESMIGLNFCPPLQCQLARSLIAQLLGFTVNANLFAYDDPDLYEHKIKYILKNDVSGLNLTFTDEAYAKNEGVWKTTCHELKENGATQVVTNANKREYLNLLADWRLSKRAAAEVKAFISGFTFLIPQQFIRNFDEREFEMLVYGNETISLEDMRENTNLKLEDFHLEGVVIQDWFWIILASFTQEQLKNLVQFVTGSSMLPSGGFESLSPPITVTGVRDAIDALPTACTCNNLLILPLYTSMSRMKEAFLAALDYGLLGFDLE